MSKLNSIGLGIAKSGRVVDRLNELLADYSIFYQKAKNSLNCT